MEADEFKYFLEHCLSKGSVDVDIPTAGKYNFPQLLPVNYLPATPIYPFNYLKSTVTEKCRKAPAFRRGEFVK